MDRPLLVIARLLTRLGPLLLLLPLAYEDDAPNHHQQTIQEIPRTIIRRVVAQIVEQNSRYADNGREDEPSLQEGHEIEISLGVRADVTADAFRDYRPEFGPLVDGDQLDKACMLHDISEGVDIGLLMQGRALSLDAEI
jgi:hypothetical protein